MHDASDCKASGIDSSLKPHGERLQQLQINLMQVLSRCMWMVEQHNPSKRVVYDCSRTSTEGGKSRNVIIGQFEMIARLSARCTPKSRALSYTTAEALSLQTHRILANGNLRKTRFVRMNVLLWDAVTVIPVEQHPHSGDVVQAYN